MRQRLKGLLGEPTQSTHYRKLSGFQQLDGGISRWGEGVIFRTHGSSDSGCMRYRKVTTTACHEDQRIKTWSHWLILNEFPTLPVSAASTIKT